MAAVVEAVRRCRCVRQVVVVDDGSHDDTGERASRAGARVVRLEPGGSKAHALAAGVAATDGEALLFVDADCLGLTPSHLDDICRPFLDRRAAMSFGTFDYGRRWNWLVPYFPPTSGQRIIPRWVFEAIPPHKLDGYTIEVMINEVLCEGRLPITARVMRGVGQRTKRDKLGRWRGARRTWWMFWRLNRLWFAVRPRTYWFYLRSLSVERSS